MKKSLESDKARPCQVIEVKNLSKTYQRFQKETGLRSGWRGLWKRKKVEVPAVKKISFNLREGELVGFLGPNGAGKTTTLKMLSGILYPTKGEARVLSFTPWERKRDFQKQISLVMGNKNQLWWDLPARETFLLNKEIYELNQSEYEKNMQELMEMLDIKDILHIPVRKLSLGQRMKCELAAALLHQPRVLFLDEPTLGLDVVAQKKMREFVRYYNEVKKTTILLTSHYMEDIKELCQRVIIINQGKIIFDGDLKNILDKYAPYKILEIIYTADHHLSREEWEKWGKVKQLNTHKVVLRVPRTQVKETVTRILQLPLTVEDLNIAEPEISDIIRKIFAINSK